MSQDEYKVLAKKIDVLQASVNRLDKDLGTDRQDLQNTEMRLGRVENVLDILRKSILALPERTQDKVADAVQPMMEQAHDLQETIENKKTMVMKPKLRKHWWKFWQRR